MDQLWECTVTILSYAAENQNSWYWTPHSHEPLAGLFKDVEIWFLSPKSFNTFQQVGNKTPSESEPLQFLRRQPPQSPASFPALQSVHLLRWTVLSFPLSRLIHVHVIVISLRYILLFMFVVSFCFSIIEADYCSVHLSRVFFYCFCYEFDCHANVSWC